MGFDLDSISISDFKTVSKHGNTSISKSIRSQLSNKENKCETKHYGSLFWKQSVSHDTDSATFTSGCVAIHHVPKGYVSKYEQESIYSSDNDNNNSIEFVSSRGRSIKNVKHEAIIPIEKRVTRQETGDSGDYYTPDDDSNESFDEEDEESGEDEVYSSEDDDFYTSNRPSRSDRYKTRNSSSSKRKRYREVVSDSDSDYEFSTRTRSKRRKSSVSYAEDAVPPFEITKLIEFQFDTALCEELAIDNENNVILVGETLAEKSPVQLGDKLISINGYRVEDLTENRKNAFLTDQTQANLTLIVQGVRMAKITRLRKLMNKEILPLELYDAVQQLGGAQHVANTPLWQSVRKKLNILESTSSGHALKKAYEIYFGPIVGLRYKVSSTATRSTRHTNR